MDAPPVQYTRASDGTGIGFSAVGSGMPFVHMPMPINHLSLLWNQPQWGPWYRALAGRFRLVQYDGRGMGLSQRRVDDYSLEGHVRDLAGVVDRLGLDRFVLFGALWLGQVAAAYAAQNPERVAALVIWAYDPGGRQNVAETLIGRDWSFFLQTIARTVACVPEEDVSGFVEILRQGCNQDDYEAMSEAANVFDTASWLSGVHSPTLVLHPARLANLPASTSTELAAEIPGAHLVLIEQVSVIPGHNALAAIRQFLLERRLVSPQEGAEASLPSGTAVILFADIADSTALTERLGDAAFRERARELDASLRQAIASNGGTAIEGKVLGDGVLAVFTSAREAIGCAQACHGAGSHAGLPLHIGIHAGDVIREGNNVYGGAVNIASRVAGLAAPGEVLVSGTVRELARTSAGVSFEDRGERELKGVGEPVRVWAVVAGR